MSAIVPSEKDTYFRQQELRGYVHDMTTALQGGVVAMPGLFSMPKEVVIIMQLYLQKGSYNGYVIFLLKHLIDSISVIVCFGEPAWGGLDKPQLWGGGMAFEGISKESFGHSGFTGTYTWADSTTGILFVFLSNRTYPSMENRLLMNTTFVQECLNW